MDDDTDRKFEEILKSAYQTYITPLNLTEKNIEEPEKSPNSVDNCLSISSLEEPEKSPNSVDNCLSISSLEEPEISPNSVEYSLSTSSLEDTIKIYNVQTGEIVKCEPVDNISPRYDTNKNDNIDIDKNSPEDDRLSDNSDVEDIVFVNGLEENKFEERSELGDLPSQLPSVKELAKKFTSMESLNEPVKPTQNIMRRQKSKENMLDLDKPASKIVYMHSLTARSISREFREELKLSMATPLTVPGGSKEMPEGIEEVTKESSRPGSPLPEPGTIKTKLAFFESLKSKFSNK